MPRIYFRSLRNLFLIDGLGACFSAFMLGVVLPYLDDQTGIPDKIFYLLSIIACIFALYSLTCFVVHPGKPGRYLAVIAGANLLYAIFTAGVLVYYRESATWVAWCYFTVEILIIAVLAFAEIRAVKRESELTR